MSYAVLNIDRSVCTVPCSPDSANSVAIGDFHMMKMGAWTIRAIPLVW